MKEASCPIDMLATREAAIAAVADDAEPRIRNGSAIGISTSRELLPLYQEWIKRHRVDGLSFRGVTTFSTDEFEGMGRGDEMSRGGLVQRELFSKIRFGRNLMLSGHYRRPEEEAASYERQIKGMGGIDWLLLMVGPDGSLGFNHPGSAADSRTRLVDLSSSQRQAFSDDFGGLDKVPARGMTMGIGTLLEASRIVVVGWGVESANAVKQALQGPVSEDCPASFLQRHGNMRVILAEVNADWS